MYKLMNHTDKNKLIDPVGRRLSYLRLSVTDLCNFRCTYCLPNGYQGKAQTDELSVNEIANLVSAFADLGTEKVRLTGGEPTLRSDITDIIRVAKAPENIKKVALTTNGWKLEKNYQKWLDAGLDQINLSIDSLDHETFKEITGKDILASILKVVDRMLLDHEVLVKINAVLLKPYGEQQFKDALDFIKVNPVSFRFIELMQTGENNVFFEHSHLNAAKIVTYLKAHGWMPSQRGVNDGPAVEYVHPDYQGRMGVIAPYSKDFCKSCNRLRVTALGKLHLCLFDSLNFDIRELLQDGQQEALKTFMRKIILEKPESHYLHNKKVGLIKNLAMIGG